jgi:predicted HAD superfamily hydrolase
MARQCGVRAYHYEKVVDRVARVDMGGRDRITYIPRSEKSLGLGIRDMIVGYRSLNDLTGGEQTCSSEFDFWFRVGYERAGILLLGFTLWLSEQLKQDGIDTLIFLARDGHIMKRCFDLVQGWKGEPIHSIYLYGSRRALVFPALLTMDEDDLTFLASGVRETVRNYLGRCGLDPEAYEMHVRAAGLPSLDYRIESGDDWQGVRTLFQTISRDVLRAASVESRHVLTYFDQLGIPSAGHIAVVDIGWLGSMQQGLEKLFKLSGRSCTVSGYYVGVHDGAGRRVNSGQRMKGYLTRLGQPDELNRWILECVELIEFLFLAPHGSCLGFDDIDGEIVPRLEENQYDAENTAKALRVQEGVLAFLDDARPLVEQSPHLTLDARGAFFPYAQIIMNPTRVEAETFGNLTHVQNFGQSERAYIAKVAKVARVAKGQHKPGPGDADASKPFWRTGYAKLTGKKLRL